MKFDCWTNGHVLWTDTPYKSRFYSIYPLIFQFAVEGKRLTEVETQFEANRFPRGFWPHLRIGAILVSGPIFRIGENMTGRTYRFKDLIRMAGIALCLTAGYSRVVAPQEATKESHLGCSSSETNSPCPSVPDKKEAQKTQDQQAGDLPDSPEAQEQGILPMSPLRPQDGSNAVLYLPVATAQRPSFGDKFTIYAHQAFGPPALIFPAFAAGMGMANPKSHYPREWKDGGGAFGRLYGDSIATTTSERTARFLTGVALHEDPRYVRSSSKNPLARTIHAVSFTFVDRTDSGRNTIASSNFAGAAAGGFVGNAYLPRGFNDLTHAEQRMAFQFGGLAIQNIAAEFQPQWGPIVRKLRIQKIIPEWWVPLHDK